MGIEDYAHLNMENARWDIFCKIVDNFGDIGVCWRVAKQLQDEYKLPVRLFVDNLEAAKHILIGIDPTKVKQQYEHVTIIRWDEDTVFNQTANMVIETFACGLPATYQENMHTDATWINLEYLSAEPWVSHFHNKNKNNHPAGVIRHFYFPGFTNATGGLLRERSLTARRDAYLQSPDTKANFLDDLGVSDNDSLKVSMFFYPNAPLEHLLAAMVAGEQKVTVLAPMTDDLQLLASFFGKSSLSVGDKFTVDSLTLHVLPFLSQADYDQLLWSSDINFVRGEDSWVRAIWAGKPFIWQPYIQTENSHIAKLNEFIDLFYKDCTQVNGVVAEVHQTWSIGSLYAALWQRYLNALPAIEVCTLQRLKHYETQKSLVAQLVAFCGKPTS